MPTLVITPRRRRREDSLDEESEASPLGSRGSSAKRQRTNLNGSRQTNGYSQEPVASAAQEHQPGAIVSVRLRNFVTYKDATFEPGPTLNMVIGPNGNGKSTLVCAICLGLGWGSQHLGRAKDVGDFVKHGAAEATIEIELKKDGRKYKTNPKITAIIRKEGNKMSFLLNGRQSNKKACQDVAKSFSIQIDNLCQFLPQDRVVEFAALSPVELLKSTQRAIASEEMIGWHGELTELGQNLRTLEQTRKTDVDELRNLESRQRMQEADVQRLRERKAIEVNIKSMVAVRPMVEFTNAKKQFDDVKARHQDAERELRELVIREGPALRAVNEKERYRNAIKNVRDHRRSRVGPAEQSAKEKHDDIALYEKKMELFEKRETDRKKKVQQSRSEIRRLDGVITGLQKQIEDGPPDFDLAAVQEQIRDLQRNRNTIKTETEQVKANQGELNDQMKAKHNQVMRLTDEMKSLDSQVGKQELKLRQINQDTSKAWEWIRKNQDQFEKPILGPPIVECSVTDSKYANMLESLIQQNDMTVLTAQTAADQEKLHRMLKDELHLKKISTRRVPASERLQTPNVELHRLGFEGWANDYIQGPDGVVAMLCEAANLHRTGIVLQQQTEEQFKAAEQSAASGWATLRSTYRVMRRAEYGSGATSTTVRDVRPARVWTDQPIDSSIKDNIQTNINDLKVEIAALREEFDACTTKLEELQMKYHDYRVRETDLEKDKNEKLKKQAEYQGLETRIQHQEEQRQEERRTLADLQDAQYNSSDERDKILIDRAESAVAYADAVLELHTNMTELQEAEIMLIEAESDVQVLTAENSSIKKMLTDKEKEKNDLAAAKQEAHQQARKVKSDVVKMQAEASEQLLVFIESYDANKTIEQYNEEIDSERQRLDLIHDGNPGAIAQFEKREKEIERLNTKVGALNTAVDEVSGKLQETRSKWEPKLDALIKQISSSFAYNMGKISCNGYVEIDKHEDFDQWAVQIFVRFREGEQMTRLDSHRQSGGERAVSTIFYLMSLQTLTKSPFRVVDEINQGMDPRNERLVHSRMVAIATGNDDWQPEDQDMEDIIRQVDVDRADLGAASGSQYFLITPKLLHDLRYEEGMTVLCVTSGEHLSEDAGKNIFKRSLVARQALRMQAVAA